MSSDVQHFVGGESVTGRSGRLGDVYNPATGEVSAQCNYASAKDVDDAVAAATLAAKSWAKTSIAKRLEIIFNFRNEFLAARNELAELIGREHGKTLSDAQGELQRAVEAIEFACSMPHLTKGEYSMNIGGEIDNFSIQQPLGVVASISPFNFPAMVPIMMSTMAVAVGNAVVLKPSERVPSASVELAHTGCARASPPRFSTWFTATRKRSMHSSAIQGSRLSASSAPPRSPSTSTKRVAATASASWRSAAGRTT